MARLDIDPQLFAVVFVVHTDSSGQAWRVRVDDSWEKTGSGSATFNESFPPGQHNAVFTPAGGNMTGQYFTVKEYKYVEPEPAPKPPPPQTAPAIPKEKPQPPQFPTKPGEPLPLPDKHEIVGTYGNRCDLMNNYTFAKSMYAHRDRYTGRQSQYTSDLPTARSRAESDQGCYLPAPPTAADWQSGIQTQITEGFQGLTKYITDGLASKSQELSQAINGIWDKLEGWLIERIVGILLKALDNEVEKDGR